MKLPPAGLLSILLLGAALGAPATAQSPCAADPRYRALDPWLGEWRLVADPETSPREVGRTVLRSIAGGCAVEEVRRLSDGSEQRALGVLDAARGVWRHTWVSSSGDTGAFEVAPADGSLRLEGTIDLRATGERLMVRALLTPRAGGGLDERLEVSSDGGASYAVQPPTAYLPLHPAPGASAAVAPAISAAEPFDPASDAAEPSAPAPAPETAPQPPAAASSVRLRSSRKAGAPAAETAMESPMTLDFELGPLADLPEGASWRTTELEPYVVDNVRIPRVTASRQARRGRVTIALTVDVLLERSAQAKVDLETLLLAGGATVARATAQGITLGKLIRSHDPETGRPCSLELELDEAAFADLFADGRRPEIRLTLAVR